MEIFMEVNFPVEELIEDFIQAGMKSFKKMYRQTPEGFKLDRHENVEIQGHEFNCWREYTVFKMGEQIQIWCPNSRIEVNLDGNNSSLEVELFTDEDQTRLEKELKEHKEGNYI